MDQQLTEFLDTADRPRVFALYTIDDEERSQKVFAWGMEFQGDLGAQVCDAEGNGYGSFSSAESALMLFRMARDLDMVYLS